MKKALAILAVLLAVTSCVDKQTGTESDSQATEEKVETTQFSQFIDSMKTVYPNYKKNIAVSNKIGDVLKDKVATLPGILKDIPFRISTVGQGIDGEYTVIIGYNGDMDIHLSIWGEKFGEDKAAALDKSKLYRITGGTVTTADPEKGIAEHDFDFGTLKVKDLTLEEIPGSHYENPYDL